MRKNNHYSPEFKIQIVEEYLKGGMSYNDLKDKHDMPNASPIKAWVKQYNKLGKTSFYKEKRGRKSIGSPKDYNKMTDAEKVKYLEMENAVLKKVAALTQKT